VERETDTVSRRAYVKSGQCNDENDADKHGDEATSAYNMCENRINQLT